MMSRKAKEDMTRRRGNDKRCQINEDDKEKEKIESDKTAMRGNWGAVASRYQEFYGIRIAPIRCNQI